MGRRHIHTRDIRCQGFKRDDGLWDIEGRLVDTKTYDFDNIDRGVIKSGDPIHHMVLRIALDDDLTVREIEVSTEASPFDICASITPDFQKLIGLAIAPGWRRRVLERLGGVRGCTHLTDMLLGPMAVTAFQTIAPARDRRASAGEDGKPPALLDSCHALSRNGAIVERDWPEFHVSDKDDR
ncbi:MAG: DUF2889 domain-containing protein [Alphaproteobacteria bacterium]